jgi:hypothetical protein
VNQLEPVLQGRTPLLTDQRAASSATLGRTHLVDLLHARNVLPGHTLNSSRQNVLLVYPALTRLPVSADAHHARQDHPQALVRRNAVTARLEDFPIRVGHNVNHANPVHTPKQKLVDAQTAVLDHIPQPKRQPATCALKARTQETAQVNVLTALLVTTPGTKEQLTDADRVWEELTQVEEHMSAWTALLTRTRNLVLRCAWTVQRFKHLKIGPPNATVFQLTALPWIQPGHQHLDPPHNRPV